MYSEAPVRDEELQLVCSFNDLFTFLGANIVRNLDGVLLVVPSPKQDTP